MKETDAERDCQALLQRKVLILQGQLPKVENIFPSCMRKQNGIPFELLTVPRETTCRRSILQEAERTERKKMGPGSYLAAESEFAFTGKSS